MRYRWQASSETRVEAVAGYKGANFYSIGLEYSRQNVVDAGALFTFGNDQKRAAMLEWEYRLSKEYCFTINNVVNPTGREKWIPYRFAGGNFKRQVSKIFTCSNPAYKSSIEDTTWVARSSTKSYAGYYELMGIKLDAHQTNSTNNRMSFKPDAGKRVTLCGSNNKITLASMVKEMP